MRDSDSRSSISRAMRCACSRMMPRNRSRASGSSRAGPCSVSMKPSSEASGVRSSWLALATKSARMRSMRQAEVRSRKNIRNTGEPRPGRCGRPRRAPRSGPQNRRVHWDAQSEIDLERLPRADDLVHGFEHVRAAQGERERIALRQGREEHARGPVRGDDARPRVDAHDWVRDLVESASAGRAAPAGALRGPERPQGRRCSRRAADQDSAVAATAAKAASERSRTPRLTASRLDDEAIAVAILAFRRDGPLVNPGWRRSRRLAPSTAGADGRPELADRPAS